MRFSQVQQKCSAQKTQTKNGKDFMRAIKERSSGENSQEVSQSMVEKKKTVTVVRVCSTRFALRVALPFGTVNLITVMAVAPLLVEMREVGNCLEGMVLLGGGRQEEERQEQCHTGGKSTEHETLPGNSFYA